MDGHRDGDINHDHCAHTGPDEASGVAWLTVDLQNSYSVDSVVVYNRIDCCAGNLSCC